LPLREKGKLAVRKGNWRETQWRLIRQLLTEEACYFPCLGGWLGLLFAAGGLKNL